MTTNLKTILRHGGDRVTCPYCGWDSAAYPNSRRGSSAGTRCPHCRESIHYDGEEVWTDAENRENPDVVWLCPQCYRQIEKGMFCGACSENAVKFIREDADE